jgi:eukaryotic-like serine/threonine-protein kinase
VAVDVTSGKLTTFLDSDSYAFTEAVWMPSGKGLLALASDRDSGFRRNQIDWVSYPQGATTLITRDTNDYRALSVSSDGQLVSAVLAEPHTEVYTMSEPGDAMHAQRIASDRPIRDFAWTADNQLIVEDTSALSTIDRNGTQHTLNTSGTVAPAEPAACSDGHYLLFSAYSGSRNILSIWRMDAEGGKLKALGVGGHDATPVCSIDGRSVFYVEGRNVGGSLMKAPVEGGNPEKISDLLVISNIDLSPDGESLVFLTFQGAEVDPRLAVVSAASGQTKLLTRFQKPPRTILRFSHDGKAVIYATREAGADNLWMQPLDGSPGRQLTSFGSELIANFRCSFDGTQFAVLRSHLDTDVVLMRDKKP